MHIPRLYIPQSLVTGETLVLDDLAAHHVKQVLRLGPGAALRVFDGAGSEHNATLLDVHRARGSVVIGAVYTSHTESSLNIILAQGIPRGDRMDFILQKAVELGVSTIQPLWMERSQARTKGERLEKRMRHWQKVMINACEQCGRSTLPGLGRPADCTSWLGAGQAGETRILLEPQADNTLTSLGPPRQPVVLLVGPEGGVSDAERACASSAGFIPIALGPRILRTETASLAVLAGLQLLWGDFR
jgi:16S rRNA (uracil1498-N3)-methyltransferase